VVKPGYDTLANEGVSNDTLEEQAEGENLDAIVAALPLNGVRTVLDIGCGTGALTRRIARVLESAGSRSQGDEVETLVYGVDISRDHVEGARRLADVQGLRNVRFLEGDFLHGDIDDHLPADVDLIVEKYLLMHVVLQEKHHALLAGMQRRLRPGGRVALIEPDVNFGGDRYPPPPEPLASVLPRIVEYYRRQRLIEWRCGPQLFHHLREAGYADVRVTLVDGRIIAGGTPAALVEHASRDVEALIEPCLVEMGIGDRLVLVAEQWRAYLRQPASLLYTPIFLGVGTKASDERRTRA